MADLRKLRAAAEQVIGERDALRAEVARLRSALDARTVAAEEADEARRESEQERDALRESAARLKMVRQWEEANATFIRNAFAAWDLRHILDGTTPIPADMAVEADRASSP